MKLVKPKAIAKLKKIRKSIGGDPISYDPIPILSKEDKPKRIIIGTHSDLKAAGFRLYGGIFGLGDKQCTLHIYFPHNIRRWGDPRFHFSECRTIKDMSSKGRRDRYVASTEHDGKFPICRPFRWSRGRHPEEEVKLLPCENCLKEINYKNWNGESRGMKRKIKKEFNVGEFFDEFKFIFRIMPLYNKWNIPSGDYTDDWAKISHNQRRLARYRCECCGADLSAYKRLLHVHHKDGNRGNNVPRNLEVVCALCHKQKPKHEAMQIRYAEEYQIREARLSSSKKKRCPTCKS